MPRPGHSIFEIALIAKFIKPVEAENHQDTKSRIFPRMPWVFLMGGGGGSADKKTAGNLRRPPCAGSKPGISYGSLPRRVP
jgi:hypothetical protein